MAFKEFFFGYIWLLLFELADADRPCRVSWVLIRLPRTREVQDALREADLQQMNVQ